MKPEKQIASHRSHILFFDSSDQIPQGAMIWVHLGTDGFRDINNGKFDTVNSMFAGDYFEEGQHVFIVVALEPELSVEAMLASLKLIRLQFEKLGLEGLIYLYPSESFRTKNK